MIMITIISLLAGHLRTADASYRIRMHCLVNREPYSRHVTLVQSPDELGLLREPHMRLPYSNVNRYAF